MTAELPMPGSIWMSRQSRPTRVVLSGAAEIVAHNVEAAMRDWCEPMSWAGTPEQFAAEWAPCSHPEDYPETAKFA